MASKRWVRAWGAVRVRYPVFQAARNSRVGFALAVVVFLLGLIAALLWSLAIPQAVLNIEPLTGVPDGFASSIFNVALALVIGVGFLLWKTVAAAEHARIDNSNSDIPPFLVFPIPPGATVEMVFDRSSHYAMAPIVDSCLRWAELSREEYFLVEAGSLDIPKLALRELAYDAQTRTLKVALGSASFYDIFFTHYAPDLVLSEQTVTERGAAPTLRNIFGASVERFYRDQSARWHAERRLTALDLFPNPLGVSGILLLHTDAGAFVVLRRREGHEVAARNRLEWSFAGLVEATSWVDTARVPFETFVRTELEDEVNWPGGRTGAGLTMEPIGFVVNPLYMYQPELFVAVHARGLSRLEIEAARSALGEGFIVVPATELTSEFQRHAVKNLCAPGVTLLKAAYPKVVG